MINPDRVVVIHEKQMNEIIALDETKNEEIKRLVERESQLRGELAEKDRLINNAMYQFRLWADDDGRDELALCEALQALNPDDYAHIVASLSQPYEHEATHPKDANAAKAAGEGK